MAEYQLYPRMLADYVSRPFRADWLLEKLRALALVLPDARLTTPIGLLLPDAVDCPEQSPHNSSRNIGSACTQS